MPALAGAGLLLAGALAASMLTSPTPDIGAMLDEIEERVRIDRTDLALRDLNTVVRPHLGAGYTTADDVRRFHILRARALYLAQEAGEIDESENHRNIIAEYLAAERRYAVLGPTDTFYLADTFRRLRMFDEAIERANTLGREHAEQRFELYKRAIRSRLSLAEPDKDGAIELLTRMGMDPDLPLDERAWVVGEQTRIRLSEGYPGDAVERLLREMPKLREASSAALADLFVLLGEGYFRLGELSESEKNSLRAEELSRGAGATAARALLQLARVDRARESLDDARDRLTTVLERFGDSPSKLPAMLALAEVDAGLGAHPDSLAMYRQLIESIEGGLTHPEVTRPVVARSLMSRFDERYNSGQVRDALVRAQLAERLFAPDEVPADTLLAIARSNRRLANEMLPEDEREGEASRSASSRRLDPATQREVSRHLRAAGAYYRAHAERVALLDNEAHADSLWQAADAFDRAGERQQAVDAFAEYAGGFPDDPRQAEARFRLGQAHLAQSDYAQAASYFRGLIRDGASSGGSLGVGPFAERSYVPLARCLLLDGEAGNDAEAEALLMRVLSGEIGATRIPVYREALLELGQHYYQSGRFERAAERLEEAIERYPDDPELDQVRYLLADSYRQSAASIAEELRTEATFESRRLELERTREQRLRRALTLFAEVRDAFDARPRLTPLEAVYLRNASYYLGDCAFDLGEYRDAIRHYGAAVDRFSRDPSSLVALVQIVNAYVEMGDLERARTADERARRFFMTLPDGVLNDPTLPMTRRDWERWLDSSSRLRLYALEQGSGR
ncbi:MAG: tetratricopeptide repeat protein [Phycisphaerales bacterium]|nr:MAG: tetratricopeptide repeat protein [Phycisphaerales bacterium]